MEEGGRGYLIEVDAGVVTQRTDSRHLIESLKVSAVDSSSVLVDVSRWRIGGASDIKLMCGGRRSLHSLEHKHLRVQSNRL